MRIIKPEPQLETPSDVHSGRNNSGQMHMQKVATVVSFTTTSRGSSLEHTCRPSSFVYSVLNGRVRPVAVRNVILETLGLSKHEVGYFGLEKV